MIFVDQPSFKGEQWPVLVAPAGESGLRSGRELPMNEQLVNDLIVALNEQTAAQREQTIAINRLAESNMALCDVIIQSLADSLEEPVLSQTYLSGKPRG